MDVATRPKRAAKRLSGSTSLSRTPGGVGDDESDEDSLSSSANIDAEPESSAPEDEDLLLDREPDPGATRRSSRGSARKLVNYVSVSRSWIRMPAYSRHQIVHRGVLI